MKSRFQKGLTLIELMVAIGILLILFALTTINLSRLPSSTSQSSGYDLLVSDLRNQQTEAMSGYQADSGASSTSPYGIHFESTSYTLFKGSVYSASDPSNFVVKLDPNLSFTGSTFPTDPSGSYVVFSAGSGDVVVPGKISISNSFTGETKELDLNLYGATN